MAGEPPDPPTPLTLTDQRARRWYITESRAFFATRAHTWDTKFGDDMPAYARPSDQSSVQVVLAT